MCKYVYAMISVYSYVYIYIHIPVESRHICAHPRSLTCPPPQHISQDVVHVSCITPTEFCYLPTKTEPHSQRSNSLFLVPASSLWSVTDNLSLSLGFVRGRRCFRGPDWPKRLTVGLSSTSSSHQTDESVIIVVVKSLQLHVFPSTARHQVLKEQTWRGWDRRLRRLLEWRTGLYLWHGRVCARSTQTSHRKTEKNDQSHHRRWTVAARIPRHRASAKHTTW